ncbi:hypothetical protein Hdeb2414_s0388g00883421 [Helianthus debilis subsp. tardiflorus]
MAETTTKRHRDAAGDTQTETPKRHKISYINEQQETTQELLDFFANLPSSDPFLDFTQLQPGPDPDTNGESVDDNNDDKNSVIRHLLEASDDELGIPSRVDDSGDGDVTGGDDDVTGGGDGGDGGYGDFWLWELEDEAANYYTLLQSELFMQ